MIYSFHAMELALMGRASRPTPQLNCLNLKLSPQSTRLHSSGADAELKVELAVQPDLQQVLASLRSVLSLMFLMTAGDGRPTGQRNAMELAVKLRKLILVATLLGGFHAMELAVKST